MSDVSDVDVRREFKSEFIAALLLVLPSLEKALRLLSMPDGDGRSGTDGENGR